MTTQELTKEVLGMSAKIAGIESALHEANTRLESVEKDVKEQGKLLQSIDRLAKEIDHQEYVLRILNERVDGQNQRTIAALAAANDRLEAVSKLLHSLESQVGAIQTALIQAEKQKDFLPLKTLSGTG